MLWTESFGTVPLDLHLRLQRESVARRPNEAARHAKLGEILFQLARYGDAVTAFEQAESLDPSNFHHFSRFAESCFWFDRADAALQVCERGIAIMPDCADLHRQYGSALQT